MTEAISSNLVNVSRRVAEIQALLYVGSEAYAPTSTDAHDARDFARVLSTALDEPSTAGAALTPAASPAVPGGQLPPPSAIPEGYALVPLSALSLGSASAVAGAASTATAIAPAGAVGALGLPSPVPTSTAAPVPSSVIPPPSEQAALRVALAAAEIGVVEDPPGSNDAPRIAEYRTATAGAGVGPWCAYFTSWIGAKAGTPLAADGQGEGYVPSMASWLRSEGRYVTPTEATPRPGDLIFFDWERDGELDHIGLVQSVGADGRIYTIEGNADDAVKQRSWSPSEIAGYGLLP